MLVIADADGPNGIAGIMGGEGSEIAPDTQTVVVEAANFERYGIARTCQALALRTDGAGRWIRGVDPYLAPQASAWTAELLVELAGGQMLPDDQDVVAALAAAGARRAAHRLRGAGPRHARSRTTRRRASWRVSASSPSPRPIRPASP